MTGICNICRLDKLVCCAYHGKIGPYQYCKDCCPSKDDHAKYKTEPPEPEKTFREEINDRLLMLRCNDNGPIIDEILSIIEVLVDRIELK